MMSRLKLGASSLVIKIMLGLIVLVFIFWGTGSYRAHNLNEVASVNGTRIDVDSYRAEYENIVQGLRQRFEGNLPEGALEMLKVREQALWRVIDREILFQEAQRLNLQVTDAEVADIIANTDIFRRDGRFDRALYENFLKNNGMSAPVFESRQRETMLMSKLHTLVLGGMQVSEQEALDAYRYQNLRLGAEAAIFQPSQYKPAVPGEEALSAWYEANKEKYEIEERIRVAYVRFAPEDFLAKVPKIGDEELLHIYENEKERFEEPEQVKASHILLDLPANASEKEIEETKNRILDLRTQAVGGADFATLAREFSQCPSASQGGELGTFTREDMVEPFSDAAFALKEGEISEPVRTPFGWHLIRVEKHWPGKTTTFEEAREELLTELEKEKAANLAYDAADAAYDDVLKGADLQEISRDRNVDLKETAFFSRSGPSGIEGSDTFAERAFSLADGDVSEIIDLGGSLYLLSPVERQAARIPELTEIRQEVLQDMEKEEADRMAKAEADAVLAKMKENGELPKGTLTRTGLFGRSGEIPGLGNYPALAQAAFTLPKTSPLPETPVTLPDGYAVFKIVERVYPDDEGFEAVREGIEDQLRVEKQRRMNAQWMESLRENAEIEIGAGFQATEEAAVEE